MKILLSGQTMDVPYNVDIMLPGTRRYGEGSQGRPAEGPQSPRHRTRLLGKKKQRHQADKRWGNGKEPAAVGAVRSHGQGTIKGVVTLRFPRKRSSHFSTSGFSIRETRSLADTRKVSREQHIRRVRVRSGVLSQYLKPRKVSYFFLEVTVNLHEVQLLRFKKPHC